MPRDVRVHLEDIVEACARVSDYSSRMSLEDFRDDRRTTDAVIRNLEVIGEAAKKIPDQVRQLIDVEWKRIAGLKDILIHEYFRVISKSCGMSCRRKSLTSRNASANI